jgi:energy-coupling factor transporter ATP-binding protein EcfA2
MKLISLNYAQFEGQSRQWRLSDLSLGNVNLLVGKNASGKTRTLNVILGLARLLSPTTKLSFISGNYDAKFDNNGKILNYILHFEQTKIISEKFILEGKELLKRGEGGIGTIWAEKIDKDMEFQAPEDQLAAVVRQDSIQHPFLAPLQQWARSLYHYPFGTPLGQDQLVVEVKDPNAPFDPKDSKGVVAIFRRGLKQYSDPFKQSIMKDCLMSAKFGQGLISPKLWFPITRPS